MFTLAQARGAIGNPAYFARGGADVRAGRVSRVQAAREDEYLIYRGAVGSHQVMFEYDEELEVFINCQCDCAAFDKAAWGCRHVAALMIAVCGGAGEAEPAQEGGEFIEGLLQRRAGTASRSAVREAPVRLYPALRREDTQAVLLGLRLGRTRPYVVRSMADLAAHAAAQERVVYGRELTFSHREDEIDERDAALFEQIVMLAEQEGIAQDAELLLRGAALDQTMRLLIGREAEVRGENGESRRVHIVRGAFQLPLDVEQEADRALLRVQAQSVVLGSAGAYAFGEEEIRCVFGAEFERIADLLRIAAAYPDGVRFGAEQLPAACARLIAPAKEGVLVRRGQALVAAHTPMPMTPRLYVDQPEDGRLTCRVRFDYCGVEAAPGEALPHIRRDTQLEEDVLAAVCALFPHRISEDEFAFEGGEEERFALLCDGLPELERMGEVMVASRLAQIHVKTRRAMTFGLARQGERLLLTAQLGGFSQEDLRDALAAHRIKRRYVRLKSGMFLSGEALEQAAHAAGVLENLDVTAEQAEGGTTIPASRAMYLEDALRGREKITLRAPKDVTDWMQRLRQAQTVRADEPAGLNAQLRGYQKEGLSWLCALSDAGFGGILADDMGLGKTVQALALLLRESERGVCVRALVVCPASLQINWRLEAARFAPGLSCRVLSGTAKVRQEAIASDDPPNLLITSYDQLRRDAQAYDGIEFTHVLLDEAQNIKNASSQAAKAVKTLRAAHRFAMTGTPIENRLSELWSIFDFLMPGYLYSYKRFRERFEAPVVRDADEQARKELQLMCAPFILRRMKRDVLHDLPEKVETVMTSEMTAEQRRLYAAHAAQLIRESEGGLADGQDRIRMLAGLTRLRQLCCDPRLCVEDYAGGSGKLSQLISVVREAIAGGHRMLVFSQFASMLELIAQALSQEGIAHFVLTGETDKAERMQLVERFNGGEGDVFLLSLKAGGTGLNLTGADVVIHYDPWWNAAAQDQATDRAYRIGQTRGVQVILLIAEGTVEERVLAIQESKRQLTDGVLTGEENLFTMDADTLREILGG